MRSFGRTPPDENGKQVWVEIDPDPQTGATDLIYFATLAQTLRLNLGESPFYANYGLPAQQAVQTQIPPDFYIARTQGQFSQYFASLIVAKSPVPIPAPNPPRPTYNIKAMTHAGVVLSSAIPLAT
jgi:hypothetical protein